MNNNREVNIEEKIALFCKMSQKLSVVIITFNEEKNIGRCLDSVKNIADEIIVVDSFSTDKTKEICEKFGGITFSENKFEGHIEQKNFAKELANNQLILSLDADEAIDSTLEQSILEVKKTGSKGVYSMNRLTNYCGQWIKHCGWYPDVKARLFEKGNVKWGGINPHDKLIPNSGVKVIQLKGDILHYSFYTEAEHLAQIHKFSTIGAKALKSRNKKAGIFKIYLKAAARFLKTYIIKLGFLDGKNGFIISRNSAYSNYLKYTKLQKLNNGETL